MTTSLTPIGQRLKDLDTSDFAGFQPTRPMQAAKARFWKNVRSNPLLTNDIGNMTLDALVMHSGAKKLIDWADKHELFLAWFCDEQFEEVTIQTLASDAIREIYDIMMSPMEVKVLTAKDKLAAANLLLQLADKFPNKRKEFVYVDKELARMSEADVDREMSKLDKLLTPGKDVLDND
jgi:hypothetical protein